MKKIVVFALVIGLASCASQNKLETSDIPFEVSSSSFQEWAGGREESGSGGALKISVSELPDEDVTFEKVYFRGRAMDCKLVKEEKNTFLVSSYKIEAGTKVPADAAAKKMMDTFEVKGSEAIIGYNTAGGKVKYVKVTGIKEKAPLAYPSRPKN